MKGELYYKHERCDHEREKNKLKYNAADDSINTYYVYSRVLYSTRVYNKVYAQGIYVFYLTSHLYWI